MLRRSMVNLTRSESHCAAYILRISRILSTSMHLQLVLTLECRVVWKRLFVHILIGRHDVKCRHRVI